MKDNRRVLIALFFILLLALPLQVFADEKNAKTNDHGHEESTNVDHEGMNQDEMEAHGQGETDDHGQGDATGDDHGDDGHGDDGHEYEEPGANVPLLSAFAAINGGFLVFGAVRKLNKKRKNGVN